MDDQQETAPATGTSRTRPADRYGDVRPPWHRIAARSAAVAVAVAGVTWVVWAGLGAGDRDVRWKDVGFDIASSSRVDVTFDVIKDPEVTATCRLEALNSAFAVVGVADVEVGPSQRREVRLTQPVTTQELAVTGLVKRCTTD